MSHSITAHQKKKLLYVCDAGKCRYQCLVEVNIVHHMQVEHGNDGTEQPLVCCATLVARKADDCYVECPVPSRRT